MPVAVEIEGDTARLRYLYQVNTEFTWALRLLIAVARFKYCFCESNTSQVMFKRFFHVVTHSMMKTFLQMVFVEITVRLNLTSGISTPLWDRGELGF